LVTYGTPLGEAGARPEGDEGIEHPLAVRLGDRVNLLGYRLAEEQIEPGRMVRLTLYWETDEPVTEPLTVFAHVVGADGQLVAQQDSQPSGGSRPAHTWTVGEVNPDPIGILIPAETPGGEYQIVVGMYHPGTGQRLPVEAEGTTMSVPEILGGDSIELGTIQIK
jgi:hypothetical protein